MRNTAAAAAAVRQQASSQAPTTYFTTIKTEMPLVTKALNPVFWGGFASAIVVVLAIQKMFPRCVQPASHACACSSGQ